MRFGEHFRDRGQEVEAQVAELKQTIFQPGDTVVVYIRSHGGTNQGRFYGPVPGSRLWKYDDVIDMLFGKTKMNGVTFCFFADACHSGWFAEYCEDHKKMFEGNSVIVYTSCAANELTPRGDPMPSGDKTGRGITSQFTMALMSVLDGRVDYPIAHMKNIIQSRLPAKTTVHVQVFTFNPDSSVHISGILREPANFPWYQFDRDRFCRWWQVVQQALLAMTGRTIASCPQLDMRRWRRQPPIIRQVAVGGRRARLTIPRITGRIQPRSVPQSGSNGLEHRKHGLSKSDREMIRRLVIKYYFRQVQELIWKYYIMEHLWLLGFHW